MMKNEFLSVISIAANGILYNISGADIRDEISAWVTLIGSIAITVTTIVIQIYHLIRDRDKKSNKPAITENEDKENDEKNG